ncbi:MAG: fibronectin type III domain-containing protein, partial [Candidatus Eisenbacteria sp.]|nr:fibronectin type III domain-containing protein [Candidatus Eisenbacteria bacterium]
MTRLETAAHARLSLPLVFAVLLTVPALTGGDSFAQPRSLATSEILSSLTDVAMVPVLPPAVCNVQAADVPEDGGGLIGVTWEVPEDAPGTEFITGFEILRYAPGETPTPIGDVPSTDREFEDESAEDGTTYQYVVRSVSASGFTDSEPSGPV